MAEYQAHVPQVPQFVGSVIEPFRGEGVYIQAKAYSRDESKAYLSRDLVKKGYQPVQVTIQNNSQNAFFLSEEGVDIEQASPGKVARRISYEGIPKSIALKVASFFFWPFLIPSAIDSAITLKHHFNMKSDYYAKSVKEEGEIIPPYSSVHRILFVPAEHFEEEFTLYLMDQNSGRFHSFRVLINT